MSMKRRDFLKKPPCLAAAVALGAIGGLVPRPEAAVAGHSVTSAVAAEALVDRQVQAYNDRDLEGFLEPYAEHTRFYSFPGELLLSGKEAMRARYRNLFSSSASLHCEVLNRIVLGNTVILLERITGKPEGTEEVAVVYTIAGDRIVRVDFIRP